MPVSRVRYPSITSGCRRRAAFRVHRHARGAQRLDVAVDRPDGDLELAGELGGGHAAAGLEEQEQGDEAGRTHVEILPNPDIRSHVSTPAEDRG